MSAPLNLVNLERVHKAHGTTVLLDDVSLGVAAGDEVEAELGGHSRRRGAVAVREVRADARVQPRGNMTEDQVQVWTAAIDKSH